MGSFVLSHTYYTCVSAEEDLGIEEQVRQMQ